MDSRIAAFIHYYAREGYVHHIQTVCNEVIKRSSSPALQFWRAYGLLASGATTEAMRELYAVQGHSETGLAATAALLTAHQSAKTVDQDAIIQLSAHLEVCSNAAAVHSPHQLLTGQPAGGPPQGTARCCRSTAVKLSGKAP
eukprot:GHUV01050502.1.p1 GENE.GHUV01050502.1~~GHUV01050502.1.p1  ORF type:complete len:142 (+),score=22.70 GHUV01050502.1:79-504(+)